MLRAGDRAAFPKVPASAIALSTIQARWGSDLEVGTRTPAEVTMCSDIHMMSSNADGRFVHKDGTPCPEP